MTETIKGGATIHYDFEIRRLWKLIDEADQLLSSIVYEGDEEIATEPFDTERARRWLERASILSPALKAIVFPPEKCSHPNIEVVRLEGKTQNLCLECGELLS